MPYGAEPYHAILCCHRFVTSWQQVGSSVRPLRSCMHWFWVFRSWL